MGEAHDAMAHLHGPVLMLDGPPRPAWCRRRPRPARGTGCRPSVRRGFYPNGYHLLLRDHDRALVEADILAWLDDPDRCICPPAPMCRPRPGGPIMRGRAMCRNWRRRRMTASGRNAVWPY